MEKISFHGLDLFYDEQEKESADIIQKACEKSIRIAKEKWGLPIPAGCRVYVINSWIHFLFHALPWHLNILMGLTFPLWYKRYQRKWQIAGGWSLPYAKRPAILVKTIRLLTLSDQSLGKEIIVNLESPADKLGHITCHELIHAMTTHLKLPMWLNEGLAVLSVDYFLGRPVVKSETLDTLDQSEKVSDPGRYRKLSVKDSDNLMYHFVRGYWVTRYLVEMKPGLVNSLLSNRMTHCELEKRVASAFGLDSQAFWNWVNNALVSHYKKSETV